MLLKYLFSLDNFINLHKYDFEAYTIPEKKNIYPIYAMNYEVYDADLYRMIMTASLVEEEKKMKVDRKRVMASVSRLERELKTDNIILMGNVENIPLTLNIEKAIYTSKINTQADRSLFYIIKDNFIAEGCRSPLSLSSGEKSHIAERIVRVSPTEIEKIFNWANIEEVVSLNTIKNDRWAFIEQNNNNLFVDRNNVFSEIDTDVSRSRNSYMIVERNNLVSKIENMNNRLFTDKNHFTAHSFTVRKLRKNESNVLSDIVVVNNELYVPKVSYKAINVTEKYLKRMEETIKSDPPPRDDISNLPIPLKIVCNKIGESYREGTIYVIESFESKVEKMVTDLKIKEEIKADIDRFFKKIDSKVKVQDAKREEEKTLETSKIEIANKLDDKTMNKSNIIISENIQREPSIYVPNKNYFGEKGARLAQFDDNDFLAFREMVDKPGILETDMFKAMFLREFDAILEDGLFESNSSFETYLMSKMYLANRNIERVSKIEKTNYGANKVEIGESQLHTLEVADLVAREYISEIIDKYFWADGEIKKGEINNIFSGIVDSKIGNIIDEDIRAIFKNDRESLIEVDMFKGKGLDRIAVLDKDLILSENEDKKGILEDDLILSENEDKNSILEKIRFEADRIYSKNGEILDVDLEGDKNLEASKLQGTIKGEMDRSFDSVLEDTLKKAEGIIKIAESLQGCEDATLDKDMTSVLECMDYLADREVFNIGNKQHEMIEASKDLLSVKMEKEYLADREIEKDSKIEKNNIVALELDREAIRERILDGLKLARDSKIEDAILGERLLEKESVLDGDLKGKKVEDIGTLIKQLSSKRDLDLKNSILEDRYRWGIGCNSPEEFFPDADINDPNQDLNTDDPSNDKNHPDRWYDKPKDPLEILYEMIIEIQQRDQVVNGFPANDTAEMLKDILEEFKKHHAKENAEEFKDIINWIEAVIDSELNNLCVQVETVKEETVIDYLKDFQDPNTPEGRWKDPEWIGNDTPEENEGVGNWINVDLTKPSGATLADLKAVLDKNGGLLSEIAQPCLDAEKKYGVNAFYIASHAIWESGWGRSQIARDKNNLFGYGAYDWSPYESAWTFRNKAHCIDVVAKHVAEDYLTPKGSWWGGSPTLKAMNKYYATDMNWANGIGRLMKQFAGDKNPPNSLLAGYTVEPYTKWYRYEEPAEEAEEWQLTHKDAPVPNFALHSPDDMEKDETSSVYIKKNSKVGGKIKFRAKVMGEGEENIADSLADYIWYDDITYSNGEVPYWFLNEHPVYDRFAGYIATTRKIEEYMHMWQTQNGNFITDATESTLRFDIKLGLDKKDMTLNLGRAIQSLHSDSEDSTQIVGYEEEKILTENFRGKKGRFSTSSLNNSGLKYFRGWGFHSGYTGTSHKQLANAEFSYNLNMGALGGYVKLQHITWCDASDNGLQILIDGVEHWKFAGHGNGVSNPNNYRATHRKEKIQLPPGSYTLTFRAKNNLPGFILFDGIQIVRKNPKYKPIPNPNVNAKLTLQIWQQTKDGSSMYGTLLKQQEWSGKLNSKIEKIDFKPKENYGNKIHIFISFEQSELSENIASIHHISVEEEGHATVIPSKKSRLKYYMDDVLKKEFELSQWTEVEFSIPKGVTKHTWEFIQGEENKSGYALLDDVIIEGIEAEVTKEWVCPSDSGKDLIDKILDYLKDKLDKKKDDPKNLDFKVWLYT